MNPSPQKSIFVRLYMDAQMLPVATAFVEKGAAAMGLGHHEALSLTLATEEIFSCICRQGQPGHEVRIDLVNGGYYVKVDFELPGPALDMHAFNLTACVLPDDDASLQDLGLLIAIAFGRPVLRFRGSRKAFPPEPGQGKVYPRAGDGPGAAPFVRQPL